MSYLIFLRAHWRFVGFGAFLTFLSSFGQTFYVALYGADIRAEFGLSNAGFGAWFSAASIVSALLLPWIGKLIDHVDLRLYAVLTMGALFTGMALISQASTIWLFGLAVFLVRFCGQGLCIHIASTGMARYFPQERGKALSLSGLGLASGEAVLPTITVLLIVWLGWHQAWLATAGMVALIGVLILPVLLQGFDKRHQAYLSREVSGQAGGQDDRSWTRGQVLADPGFYALMALLLSFPYMATAVFFHQGFIADAQGWSLELIAGGFFALAVVKVVTSLFLGPVIDRYSATRLVPAIAVPFTLALAVILIPQNVIVPFVYLGLFGVTIGMLQPIMSAMLAERYGTGHLGAIRSMAIAVFVFAAAVAPVTLGWLLDAEVLLDAIVLSFMVYVVVTGVVAQFVLRREAAAAAA